LCVAVECWYSGAKIYNGSWCFVSARKGFNNIQTWEFTTPDFSLAESDFGLVAIRAQQVCPSTDTTGLNNGDGGCSGSQNVFGFPNDPPGNNNVPDGVVSRCLDSAQQRSAWFAVATRSKQPAICSSYRVAVVQLQLRYRKTHGGDTTPPWPIVVCFIREGPQ
jgi:hypothetical protein